MKNLKPLCAAWIISTQKKRSTQWPETEAVSHTDHKRPFSKATHRPVTLSNILMGSEVSSQQWKDQALSPWDFFSYQSNKKKETFSLMKDSDIGTTEKHHSEGRRGALSGTTQGDFPKAACTPGGKKGSNWRARGSRVLKSLFLASKKSGVRRPMKKKGVSVNWHEAALSPWSR